MTTLGLLIWFVVLVCSVTLIVMGVDSGSVPQVLAGGFSLLYSQRMNRGRPL